jgi:succinate dehydrogenase / fumarate reductase iron-sulfur subunit
MNLTLKVWRQRNPNDTGRLVTYEAKNISTHMSFLEMLDVINTDLVKKGEDPIAFDHDCREGICGSCGLMVNGRAHGPGRGIAACQLHMRVFKDGDVITIEPWRANAFPIIKDLVVDRTALDRIMQAGGYTSAKTGGAPDGNAVLVPKPVAEEAMDAAGASDAGRVLPRVPILRPCSLSPLRSHNWRCSPREESNAHNGSWQW